MHNNNIRARKNADKDCGNYERKENVQVKKWIVLINQTNAISFSLFSSYDALLICLFYQYECFCCFFDETCKKIDSINYIKPYQIHSAEIKNHFIISLFIPLH